MWKHLPSAHHRARAFNPSMALWSLERMGKQMKKQQMLCRMQRA